MQTWMEKKEDTSKFNTKKKPLEKLKEKKKKQRAKSKELKTHKEKEVSERHEKKITQLIFQYIFSYTKVFLPLTPKTHKVAFVTSPFMKHQSL